MVVSGSQKPHPGGSNSSLRWLLLVFFVASFPALSAPDNLPQDIPSAIRLLQEAVARMNNLDDIIASLEEFLNQRPPEGTLYKQQDWSVNTLQNPVPVVASTLPDLCDEAIYDFRQTLRKDFIKVAGAPDGRLTKPQFTRLVSEGRFPFKGDSDTYFTTHDRDHDGNLSIGEFTPSPSEVPHLQDVGDLTAAFVEGKPYPTGQMPAAYPTSKPAPKPLFLTKVEIEERIRNFATAKGLNTVRGPEGNLLVLDPDGRPIIPLPPGVLPIELPGAEEGLRDFATSIGGTTDRDANGRMVVIGPGGKIIPTTDWPAKLQPPYMPIDVPPGN